MTVQYPRFKAAACHASSVFLDADKTAEKACDLIAEAAANGAALVVFPESFLPGFPVGELQLIYNHGFFRALVAEAQKFLDGAIRTIRMAARRHGVHVSLGFTEGTGRQRRLHLEFQRADRAGWRDPQPPPEARPHLLREAGGRTVTRAACASPPQRSAGSAC